MVKAKFSGFITELALLEKKKTNIQKKSDVIMLMKTIKEYLLNIKQQICLMMMALQVLLIFMAMHL